MKPVLLVVCAALLAGSGPTDAGSLRLLDPKREGLPKVVWSTWVPFTGQVTIADRYILVGSMNMGPFGSEKRAGWGTIIQRDDRVDQYANCLTCLDARDGKLLWRSFHASVTNRAVGIPGQPITSQPAVEGDRVYYVSVNSEFTCVDLLGFHDEENDGPFVDETVKGPLDADVIWKIDLVKELGINPRAPDDVLYLNSSPVVHGDLVYLVTGHGPHWDGKTEVKTAPSFLAVHKRTGKIAWSSAAPALVPYTFQNGSPVILPKTGEVVFPGGDGCLYGFHATRGTLNWKADLNALGGTKDLYFGLRPSVVEGTIYVSLRKLLEAGPQRGAPVIALEPGVRTGGGVLGSEAVKWTFGKELKGIWGNLVVDGDTIYVPSAPNFVHAVNRLTGKERWRLEVGHAAVFGSLPSLALVNGILIYSDDDKNIHTIQPGDSPVITARYDSAPGNSFYGRPTVSSYGVCLPLFEGVVMMLFQ
jgi:outer membrane protein assembly factor BamB